MSAMAREISETLSVLERNRSQYYSKLRDAISDESFDAVVLAARGSSDHAATFAAYLIETEAKIPTILAKPSITTVFGGGVRYPKSLFVGISQSGMSPDIVSVIQDARRSGHATIAITNAPASPLSDAAAFTLDLNCGVEQSVAATKTYTASLLASMQLARALSGADAVLADSLPTDADVDEAKAIAARVAARVCNAETVFALGRGYSFASAKECALKLIECARIPCLPYSIADFEHGPKALASSVTLALLFGDSSPSGPVRFAAERVGTISSDAHSVLADALRLQWLAVECATLRGLDPDNPAYLEKVTKTY